jgi:RNA polymerase sigma-B factor
MRKSSGSLVQNTPIPLRDNSLATLVVSAQQARTQQERAELEADVIAACRPMAWGLAHRYAYRGAELEDLRAVADVAVLGAIRRFDGSRGEFRSFASATVLGEIKKYFRDFCWTIRPTRSVQELQARVSEAALELQQSGVPDTAETIARHLGVPLEAVREAAAARDCFSPASLDAPAAGGSDPRGSSVAVEEIGFAMTEDRLVTAHLYALLSGRERELLRLRFVEELSQRQIADTVGSTQKQVSRDLERILRRLRSDLQEQDMTITALAG